MISLRPSDVLTKIKFARETSLSIPDAEKILIELYKEGALKLFIRIPCKNDESHYLFLNSLEDYYSVDSNMKCTDCELGFEWKKAMVGFKRGELNDKIS